MSISHSAQANATLKHTTADHFFNLVKEELEPRRFDDDGRDGRIEMKVQGILGVTLDDTDVFVVHINELYELGGVGQEMPRRGTSTPYTLNSILLIYQCKIKYDLSVFNVNFICKASWTHLII